MKEKIKQLIEQLYAQMKMVDTNYKQQIDDCEIGYKNLCNNMQEQLCILNMALNSPDDIAAKLNL